MSAMINIEKEFSLTALLSSSFSLLPISPYSQVLTLGIQAGTILLLLLLFLLLS